VNTPSSRSSALLSLVTLLDQRLSSDDSDLVAIHYSSSEANNDYTVFIKMQGQTGSFCIRQLPSWFSGVKRSYESGKYLKIPTKRL
jgi:hypothetical protein